MGIKAYDGKYYIVHVSVSVKDWWFINYVSGFIPIPLMGILEKEIDAATYKNCEFDLFDKSGEYVFAVTLQDDSENGDDPYWNFTRLSYRKTEYT